MNPEVLALQTPLYLRSRNRRRRGSKGGMKIEAGSLGIGGAIGAVLAGLVTLVAGLIKRNTAIKTHEIDDRSKVTADANKLLELYGTRLSSLEADLKEQRASIKHLQNREAIFTLTLSNIGGELRVLNGFLNIHLLELRTNENPNREVLIGQAELMAETMQRIREGMDADAKLLMQEYAQRTEVVSPH